MKKTLVFAISAALASAIFAQDAANAAKASTEERAKAAIEKGLNWLVSKQMTNGVWSMPEQPALTGLPAWALSAVNRPQDKEAIKKACEFIRSCSQEDGGIYAVVPGRRGGSLGTYNTAIAMTALHYADNANSTRVIQKAREYVAATQLLGDDEYHGGFGYERNTQRPYADLNNSAWAISAMRLTQDVEDLRPEGEKSVDINWDAALAFVNNMQLKEGVNGTAKEDDGGFLYKPETGKARPPRPEANEKGATPPNGKQAIGPDGKPAVPRVSPEGKPLLRSYGSITYSGLLSMIYAQVGRDDPRVVSAIDYARRHWTLDENPGMQQQGIYYYFTIMARALSLMDLNELPPVKEGDPAIAWRDELIEKVLSLQNEDGSWQNSDNRFWESNPILCTSYGVLTLEYALRMFR